MSPLDHVESTISQPGARHAEAHGINGAREEAFSKQSEGGCLDQNSRMESDSVNKLLPSLEIEGLEEVQPSSNSKGEKSGDSNSKSTTEDSGESHGEKNAESSENADSEMPQATDEAAADPGEQGGLIELEITPELTEAEISDLEEKIRKLLKPEIKDFPPVQENPPPVRDGGTVERPASSIPSAIN